MQRQIIDGVPYFVDGANKLYTWENESIPQHIGTYDPKTKTVAFEPNHLTGLADKLIRWRENQTARIRKKPVEETE